MALGDLKIRIGIDATGIEKGLRNAQKKLEKSASRFAAIGSNISMGISAPLGLYVAFRSVADGEKVPVPDEDHCPVDEPPATIPESVVAGDEEHTI